ncbi:MAG: AI-2E family transporter [Balneolaceae bacterium]
MENAQRWYIKYTIILAGFVLTIFAMIQAATILKLLLFSFFFSILVLPVCEWLERHRVSRILSAIIAILLAFVVLAGLSTFVYFQLLALMEDVGSLKEPFEELIGGLQQFLSSNFGFDGYIDFDTVKQSVYNYMGSNAKALTEWLGGAVSLFTSIVLVPVFMFLILMFRDFLQESAIKIFERKGEEQRDTFKLILTKVKEVVQNYITGILIVSVILAVVYSIMLTIIGIDYAIFFGIFAGALAIVPIIGPIVGSVIPIMYSLLTMDSLFYPLIILAGFYIVETLEGNFLEPVVLGRQVSLNALSALLLLYVGAEIWGLAGMILFIPIGAILKATFDEVESLKPIGYLMGRVPDEEFHKSEWSKKITGFFKRDDNET